MISNTLKMLKDKLSGTLYPEDEVVVLSRRGDSFDNPDAALDALFEMNETDRRREIYSELGDENIDVDVEKRYLME